jgi:hypothetical protein
MMFFGNSERAEIAKYDAPKLTMKITIHFIRRDVYGAVLMRRVRVEESLRFPIREPTE